MAVQSKTTALSNLDWERIANDLDAQGFAETGPLLTDDEAGTLRAHYEDDNRFRSHIIMKRHGFGEGEYKYFNNPLPPLVQDLRETVYPRLAPLANQWMARMGMDVSYPDTHQEMLALCRQAGQNRPTPLLLRYRAGDYNCLHQDLYGEVLFPIQLAVLLSEPGEDFQGGEFVLTEQRPRMQSKAEVVPLKRGEGVLFAVNKRPKRGVRGDHRVVQRHGVSRIRQGERFTLGVIFHDGA